MSYRRPLTILLAITCLCAYAVSQQQKDNRRNMLRTNKLDTLKLKERFNVKTNMVGWLLMSPNIGIEMNLGSHNWCRWSIGISGRSMWATSNQVESPYTQHNLSEGRLHINHYWHGRGLKRSWFTGAYAGYSNFDIKLSQTGYCGNGYIFGMTFGTVAPLYGYSNGSSIDLEMSVNAGVLLAKVDEYVCSDDRQDYITTRPSDGRRLIWNPLPLVFTNDLIRVSFVYHLGPTVANRYRRRIAIDNDYRELQNTLALQRDSTQQALQQQRKQRQDSLMMVDYERRFEKQRLELERQHLRDSLQRVKHLQRNEK